MIDAALLDEAAALLQACRTRSIRLATAESCTGGLIAAVLTAIAGASDVLDCGFVTYSNQSKTDLLGVPAALIASEGAVSEPVARAMAEGALARCRAGIAISVTGLAGPGGGGDTDKPVGLLCFGLARPGLPPVTGRRVFAGDRTAVRAAAVAHAFSMIRAQL